MRSHPTMGAWIEILTQSKKITNEEGRTPRWVRGLKFIIDEAQDYTEERRTPRWVRGLKFIF